MVHPEAIARNPLPENIASVEQLPGDAGWWGYSFRDVPRRRSGETFIARIPHCRIISARDPAKENDFYPAILTSGGHALDLREIRFRPLHAPALRRAGPPRRIGRATWIIERVYHNHSHWLTAHLPKLLLLRERGELDPSQVLLPRERTEAMDASMRMTGMEPDAFASFATGELLEVEELTIVGVDRFRPELLRLVPRALGTPDGGDARLRIFISRQHATRRRLVNEEEIWRLLRPAGFDRVCMEDLSFQQQAELMRQAAVVVAPHGAGLTNMLLCPAGARIVEMADLSFPNPNFYAMASALGHRYWIIEAESVGAGHPLRRDMRVDPARLAAHLHDVLDGAGGAAAPAERDGSGSLHQAGAGAAP